jgi:hypothetical protein
VPEDSRAAVGLVSVDSDELWFEGDVEGTGDVSVIRYYLDPSTANGCPCLRRSQLPKVDGDPLTEQSAPSYQVQVQGVLNTDIFSAYTTGGTAEIVLPVDFTADGPAIASTDTIKAKLTIQSTYVDPQTRERPMTTLITTVRLNNCSQAATGYAMSCE